MLNLGAIILSRSSEEDLTAIIISAKQAAVRDTRVLRAHHDEKLDKLRGKTKDRIFNDSSFKSKWVMNLSDKDLKNDELSVLQKGLQFAVVTKNIPKLEIVPKIEDGIYDLEPCDKDLIRADVTKILTTFKTPKPNITKAESSAIQALKKDPSIRILKADKGNCTVVLNTSDYLQKMRSLLSDSFTYSKIKSNPVKKLERKMNAMLLKLNRDNEIDSKLYFNLCSTDGILPRSSYLWLE